MKPSEYPLSSEVKPEAGYVSTTMAPTPVITELSEVRRSPPRRPVLKANEVRMTDGHATT